MIIAELLSLALQISIVSALATSQDEGAEL
jgi:hypothetical protein